MHEEKGRSDSLTPTKEDAERDATSKETVSDLEKSGETSERGSGGSSVGYDNTSSPSPDGQLDGPPDGAGPGDEAGPM